ncbi:MAG TPA: hypothetical protein VGS07_30630 [Thermoanaerobaculia bacterium]|jgi:hypothetical protein|nr:hypothetical protein [Thermoanaerobaculia bacterium]
MDAQGTGRIRALAVVVAVFGFAAPGYTSSEEPPKPELKIVQHGGKRFTSWVESEIATGEGVRLKLTNFEKTWNGVDYSYITLCAGFAAIPEQVSDNKSYSFCYASLHDSMDFHNFDTAFSFHYDILVPNGSGEWVPGGYWVDGAVKVPMIGAPRIGCEIKQSGSTDPAAAAPFSCASSFTGSGPTSKPHWKVTAKEVQVIDASNSANAARAAQLIADNCKITDTPRCAWTRTQKSSAFLADRNDWQSLTNWADSCPPTDPNRLFVLNSNRNVQISWSDKVGGKISAKVSGDVLVYKVEGTIEANFEHSITQSDSYGEGYTYTIPYNYRSALYLQHGMLEVSGDFPIITDSERFLVKNAVFRFPLQRDVQVEGRGQPVPRGVVIHVDVPCSEKAPANGAPPPAVAPSGLAARAPRQ